LQHPGSERENDTERALRLIVDAVDHGRMSVFRSTIMATEVLGGPVGKRPPDAVTRARLALSRPHVIAIPVDLSVERKANELVIGRGLDSMDALHAASAQVGRCDQFFTLDRPLARRLAGWDGPPAGEPFWDGDEPLL
jgi:predicted nucleic acid-binding protein